MSTRSPVTERNLRGVGGRQREGEGERETHTHTHTQAHDREEKDVT